MPIFCEDFEKILKKFEENLLKILKNFRKKYEKFEKILLLFIVLLKKYYTFRINNKFYSVLTKLCKKNWRNFENFIENFESFKENFEIFKKF